MKLLLIEDEIEFARDVRQYLAHHDMLCEWAGSADKAAEKIMLFDYDCVLLDLSLPDGNGLTVINLLKQNRRQEGIIVISAREALESRLEALKAGADDYLTKPFHLSELAVRVQALHRRKFFDGQTTLSFHEIEIDLSAMTVCVRGRPVGMTRKQLSLLIFLISNKNRVLSKAALAEHLSGDMAYMLDNHDFVYTHIKNLKRKLQQQGANDYIKTIYGIGYQWKL